MAVDICLKGRQNGGPTHKSRSVISLRLASTRQVSLAWILSYVLPGGRKKEVLSERETGWRRLVSVK